ncbi:MAG: hypothetical protein V3T17_02735 [Pseudomonadales bacterium]
MTFWFGKKTAEGYQPSWLYRLLLPKASGNTINGVGETELRRPGMVYHFAMTTWRFPHFLVNVMFIISSSFPLSYLRTVTKTIKLGGCPRIGAVARESRN